MFIAMRDGLGLRTPLGVPCLWNLIRKSRKTYFSLNSISNLRNNVKYSYLNDYGSGPGKHRTPKRVRAR
jgi:hypothetical protein